MENTKKDVYIVGTGIAASIMAKQLVGHVFDIKAKKFVSTKGILEEKLRTSRYREINIQMFEAGLESGLSLDGEKAYKMYDKYYKKYSMATLKVTNSPYYNLSVAPSPDVLDIPNDITPDTKKKGYLVQNGPMPFASDAIRTGGGTTLHWLGSTPRMLPNDFELHTKYNRAVDWPIKYNQLKHYYELAELEIGISGNVKAQSYPHVKSLNKYYGRNYEFPMSEIPTSYLDGIVKDKIENINIRFSAGGNKYQSRIKVISTPQARNSFPGEMLKTISHIGAKYFNKPKDSNIQYKLSKVKISNNTKNNKIIVGSLWDQYQGNRCEGNAACVPFCPVQAKYNALKTLKQVLYFEGNDATNKRRQNVDVKAQHIVYKVEVDNSNKVVKLYVRVYGKNTSSIDENGNEIFDLVPLGDKIIDTSNSIVILAANAFENVKILLNSPMPANSDYKVVGNRSDQLGRNLMDHMVMLTWTKTDESIYPYRGPGSTSNISSFRDGNFRKEFSAWISPLDNGGWSWPTGSPDSDLKNFIADDSLINKINQGVIEKQEYHDLDDNIIIRGVYGEKLRQKMGDLLSKQLLFHWEVEQLPNPENRVTIDENYVDAIGLPRPVINYNITDYEKKAMIAAKNASDELIKKMGLKDYTNYSSNLNSFVHENQLYQFNGAGHIVGTHRMGTDSSNSVTNSHCKSWDHPNLYLIGTGCMPTLGTSNPTLTMSAITIRSAESVLTDLHHQFISEKK